VDVIAQLESDGYALLSGIVSVDRLTEFADEILAAYEELDPFRGGGSISGHLNCYPGEASRFILTELETAGICDLIGSIRAGRDDRVRATLNFNRPGSVAQHYHMDGAFADDFLICNIAVVDTDTTNGAIDLLPTTNRQYYPFWKYALERKYRLSKRIAMAQGDVLLRKSTLWHRGMPNLSTRPRPMMAITFGEASAPLDDPFAGPITFYPNWYGTGRFGELRERIEVAAPVTRSAYRFMRSLIGHGGYS
jgi:hypothetical protein